MDSRALVAVALCSCAVTACEGEPPADVSSFVRTDSVDVEVVTSHAPAWTEEDVWRVSRRPVLQIGEIDGPLPFTFGNVRDVGWLPDGRVYVGDEQAHSVRIFSGEGEFLETVGREGRGPGELQWFLTVSPYAGDSLWVYDYAQRAVSVFAPDLTFARRFRNPLTEGNYWVADALSDGRFLLYSPGHSRVDAAPGFVPDTSWIVVAARDGSAVDTIGAFEVRLNRVGPGGRLLPFFLRPYGTARAVGNRVAWMDGREFQYTIVAVDGSVERIVRKARQPVETTDEIVRDFEAHYAELLGDNPEGGPERIRRYLDRGVYAEQLPAASPDLLVDPLGYVWVGRYHFPGARATAWEVFDTAGVWQGTVTTPAELDVHEIGTDRIIGVAEDEYDVPYVEIYELDRRGSG